MNEIFIPSPQKLKELKEIFKREGKEKIHLLTDFDKTLTQAFVDGEEVPSIISVLRSEGYLTPDYPQKAYALYNHYHPYEKQKDLSLEEKKKKMEEWWRKHFKLLIESGLKKEDIEKVVTSKKIRLKKGTKKFLTLLKKRKSSLDNYFLEWNRGNNSFNS